MGETTDMAPVAVWMVSDKAGHNITGTTIHVDAEMLLESGFRAAG